MSWPATSWCRGYAQAMYWCSTTPEPTGGRSPITTSSAIRTRSMSTSATVPDWLSLSRLLLLAQWVAQGCAVGIQPFRWDEFGDVFADADFPLRVVDQVMMPPAQQHQI